MTKSIFSFLFWAFTTALLLTGFQSQAVTRITHPDQFYPIYNYQNDWLVYSSQYKNYVPFSQDINEGSRYVSTYVDLIKNRNYYLLLKSEAKSYLFLEGALQKEVPEQQWLVMSIDSLYKIYKKDELLLTIYGGPGIGDKNLLLCNERKKNEALGIEAGASSFINIKPIAFSSFGNFAVLALLLILILNAWTFNANPLAFTRLINPVEFIRNDPRDLLSKLNKPYSNSIIFFVVIVSMLTSFVLVFLAANKINIFSVSTILSERGNTLQLMGDFFLLSTIFFLLFYGKYVLMVMVGNMLNLDKVVDVIFIKIVQSSYLFYVAVFLLVFMLTFNGPVWLDSVRPYVLFPFLLFYTIRFLALYIVTLPQGTFINLYLFSYLCVIEIIPLIIGIKFAL
ncbi:DUF4271 domain-containing protein [Dyadobacter sp. CY312]|uniref:DUF4271 domain-containing protein n=1 Tax=Dyadobacter sp. CY312 TaxID=2907303 RepID=UPI001F482DAF|nr:DUF4271 domain-containing protein [Dyadobacter sp. CY312]MCE7043388.1 DUF4271 domain-containing protein [Dyadobacter sp. CY312]